MGRSSPTDTVPRSTSTPAARASIRDSMAATTTAGRATRSPLATSMAATATIATAKPTASSMPVRIACAPARPAVWIRLIMARNLTRFWQITVPLSKNGIIAGCMLVFIPVVGEFVIPELLGGPETLMIGRVLWQEFFNNRDWPVASALAVVMLVVLLIPIILFNRNQAKELEGKA